MSFNRTIVEQLFGDKPLSEQKAANTAQIRVLFQDLAGKLVALLPEGDDAAGALKKLREARLACDTAVALAPWPCMMAAGCDDCDTAGALPADSATGASPATPPRSFNFPTRNGP